MSAADFNELYDTHLSPFSTQTLRAYNAARMRFKGKANIREFLAGSKRTPIAAMGDACIDCGHEHEGPCVGALLGSMKTPEVEVKKQVEFYDVWKAWVDLEQNDGFSTDEIKNMAFIRTNPPLGFDINDEEAVKDFILDNTFLKNNMHKEEVEFLDGHTEHGPSLRAIVINLEKMNLSDDVPVLLRLKA